jgi:RNA polymerase sigma-70 factor (ECF subfamily)
VQRVVTSTPVSLLKRLRTAKPEDAAWRSLQDIYSPLIFVWLSRTPGIGEEASDLAQEVLIVVSRDLPKFDRQREGSFRAWLRKITLNRARAFSRQRRPRPVSAIDDLAEVFLAQLEDPASELTQRWNREHDEHVLRQLLTVAEACFSPKSWRAFQRLTIDGHSVSAVAAELGMSENAVLIAKCRVLKKLREEAADFLD